MEIAWDYAKSTVEGTTMPAIRRNTSLVVLATLLLPVSANAAFIEIVVEPTPDSWFTMTGSLEFDALSQTYSNLTVNITGDIGPFSFSDTACETCPLSGSSVGLIDPTLSLNYFLTDFTVTWAGGALTAIFRGNSFQLDEPNGRLDGTYSLQALTSVPESGTLALLGIGLAAMGLIRRRRTQ
jgi:hypothetical protein